MKKRAFTLTELLVVVVIVGVLSAVVLPKFTKILQTRKTTEAENVMAAVRNEQEARCMVGRDYTADTTKLASLPKANSKNYTYSLDKQGITATAKDGEYVLQIPSYTDGRICCSGEGCDALNKDYPKCGSYTLEQATCEAPDVTDIPEEEPTCNLTDYTRTCQEEGYSAEYTGNVTYTVNADCTGHTKADTCTKPVEPGECTPGETETKTRCNLCGTKTRTCQENGQWGEYGACSVSNREECLVPEPEVDCNEKFKPAEQQSCGCGGTQTRTVTCMTLNKLANMIGEDATGLDATLPTSPAGIGRWVTGSWGACQGENPNNCNTPRCTCGGDAPGTRRQGPVYDDQGEKYTYTCQRWVTDQQVQLMEATDIVLEEPVGGDNTLPEDEGINKNHDSHTTGGHYEPYEGYFECVDPCTRRLTQDNCTEPCKWLGVGCPSGSGGGGGGGGGRGGGGYLQEATDADVTTTETCDTPCTAADLAMADYIVRSGLDIGWHCGCD